jgi:hypothetical protein
LADVQGISENFFEYVSTKIRLSDIAGPSASSTKKTDDFKEILFADPKISYIPIGAKIKTMGSKWLVRNPSNIASAQTQKLFTLKEINYQTKNTVDYIDFTHPVQK